ncbi:MAG TPA: NAD+ synthase [Dehalococcoidia bacterium]
MQSSVQELSQKLVSWVINSVTSAGGKGAVFGMSGGIDSAVVAVLCKRAFPESVLGIIMPCHSGRVDREHAELVASKFDIPVKAVALDSVFDSLMKAVPNEGSSNTKEMAENNIKPRLRMVTLYYLANRLNYLVVGSSNRSELAVGYFTKHGDGGSDLIPLGNLVKRQVRELAEYLEIPRAIIDKPPSAGLWDGQTDEAELGLTYEELDNYLITGKAGAKTKEKIESKVRQSMHKRCMPPIPQF